MKTIPFNLEHAKAGRPVGLKNYKGIIDRTGKVLSVHNDAAWFLQDGDNSPLTYMASQLFHPADPCPGHNPAQLDEWKVGTHEGWRLLEPGEIVNRKATGDIEGWCKNQWGSPYYAGNLQQITYRTRRPPGYFLPKVVTRNIRPDELPKVFIVSSEGDLSSLWVTAGARWAEIEIGNAVGAKWLWSRSLDGPWNKFTVEESK